MSVDYNRLQALGREVIKAIGEDPDRPGLVDTPRRWASSWREFIDFEPGQTDICFESITTDQMVIVSGMRVWSMCEHHLLPFWCNIAVGYIASDRVLGLSKFARIAHKHAHKLQLQERLVHDIATDVQYVCGTSDVAVLAQGEHLCMSMRGITTPAVMTSSVMWGVFREKPEARSEFLSLVSAVS